MTKRKHLIIGCGSAGLTAAEEIRRINSEDEIKVVTSEDYLPYSPTILPYLLSGRTDETKLPMRKDDYFDNINATFVRGKEVIRLLSEAKEVMYKDGETETFDTLLIASGSRPVKPDIKGLDKVGFLPFHTLGDFRILQRQLIGRKDITIYGGGLVAMELAIALLEAGYPVRLVVRSRILRRYFDPAAESLIRAIFLSRGAHLLLGKEISEVNRRNGKIQIALSKGSSVHSDILVCCIGVNARSDFIKGSGVSVNKGILVDHRMMTNIKDVYAAGDVAEAPDFFTGEYGMNQTIISAMRQGRIAGSNMAGVTAEYEGWISSNIFNFFGNTAFSAGLSTPTGGDYQVLFEEDDQKNQFKKLVYDGDRLVGGMFLNVDLDPGVILYLIDRKVNIGAHKQMLFEQPREISRWLMLEAEQREATPIQG